MKYLERYDGIKIGVIYERVHTGEHNIIHTRSENMTADIYTKPFPNHQLLTWNRLRMLINLYTRQQISEMNSNPPDNEEAFTTDTRFFNGSKYIFYNSDNVNGQYYHVLEGSSTAGSDFRVAAKQKPKKSFKKK